MSSIFEKQTVSVQTAEMFNPSTMVRIKEEEKPEEMPACIARPNWALGENVQQSVVKKEETEVEIEPGRAEWATQLEDGDLKCEPIEDLEGEDCECAQCVQGENGAMQQINQNEEFPPSTLSPFGLNNVEMSIRQSAVVQDAETSGNQIAEQSPASTSAAPHPSTKPKRHQCSQCGKSCISPSQLLIHQQIHSQGRPFVCTVPGCTKAFKQKCVLIRHLHFHSNTLPFKCTWPGCSKSFHSTSQLEDHLNTHTDARPHLCPHCPSAFSQRSNLRVHLRLHTDQLPYQCGLCFRRFNTKQNLTKHMLTRQHLSIARLI